MTRISISLVVVALLIAACAARTRLETLIVLATAENEAIIATEKFDHGQQITFRERYAKATTLDDVQKIDADVAAHNARRDQAYAIFDLVSAAITSALANQISLDEVFKLVEKARQALSTFGVQFTFLKKG